MVESARTPWLALQHSLAERGVALLALLLPAALAPPAPSGDACASEDLRLIQSVDGGGLTLPWATRANRPALRLIALQIDALQALEPAAARILPLMAWLIRLNPNDNHGYRAVLAQEWLRESQPGMALALMDRYPEDIAAAVANRALALLLLDRRDEAAAHWAARGEWVVEIRRALLAKRYPRPRELDQDFVSVGGKADAWLYREVMRDTWAQSGALRWLAEQPAPKTVRAARKPRVAEPPAPPPGKTLQDDAAASSLTGQSATAMIAQGRERLARIGGDPVRAHGVMVAAALAPDGGSPAGWISLLIKPSPDFEPAFTSIDDANRLLGALTAWYNAIVDELGPAAPDGPRVGALASPWLAERTSDAVSRWAAGFMAYVAAEPYAWRRLRPANPSTLLAPLRQLAARAPLTATEKADPSRVRDRADDDAPLLALVDDSDPVALLDHALTRLVERVGSLRAYSPKGKLSIDLADSAPDLQEQEKPMKNMIRCEACGKATPGYDIVSYTSIDEVSRQLCDQCYNAEVASMMDLTGFGDFRLDPISITDCTGDKHEFHLRVFLRGGQVAVEAFELEDDEPAGHQFQILGDVEDDILALVGRLIERIRRRLAVRYLQQDEGGLQIAQQTVCGQIQWDDEADDGRVPMLVIDGRKVSWEQFGRMLMTFESWQFRMEIVDPSDEV